MLLFTDIQQQKAAQRDVRYPSDKVDVEAVIGDQGL